MAAMKARPVPEAELFAPTTRTANRETAALHEAVVWLRKTKGLAVNRVSSHQSMVGGSLVENNDLTRLAKALGWEKGA